MKKLILALIIFAIPITTIADGIVHRSDVVFRYGTGGQVFAAPRAQVWVYVTGTTTLATLYTDTTGSTTVTQPITADSVGNYSYYVRAGLYDETIVTSSGTRTISGVSASYFANATISSLTVTDFSSVGTSTFNIINGVDANTIANHSSLTGTNVHGLGTLSTQNSNSLSTLGTHTITSSGPPAIAVTSVGTGITVTSNDYALKIINSNNSFAIWKPDTGLATNSGSIFLPNGVINMDSASFSRGIVSGGSGSTSGSILTTNSITGNTALQARSVANGGNAIVGWESSSVGGIGVYGYNDTGIGNAYGVYGYSAAGTTGIGVGASGTLYDFRGLGTSFITNITNSNINSTGTITSNNIITIGTTSSTNITANTGTFTNLYVANTGTIPYSLQSGTATYSQNSNTSVYSGTSNTANSVLWTSLTGTQSFSQNVYTAGSRTCGTNYRNTGRTIKRICVTALSSSNNAALIAYSDATATPTTQLGRFFQPTATKIATLCFDVLPGNYYRADLDATATVEDWVETFSNN